MFAKLFSRPGSPDTSRNRTGETQADEQESLAHAAAMLFFEVAWADHDITSDECARIDACLQDLFGISQGSAQRLAAAVHTEHAQATSIYPFTRRVKDSLSADERYRLMVALWQIALADQNLASYEESAIRRISELLHVSHSGFIRAKREARDLRKST